MTHTEHALTEAEEQFGQLHDARKSNPHDKRIERQYNAAHNKLVQARLAHEAWQRTQEHSE